MRGLLSRFLWAALAVQLAVLVVLLRRTGTPAVPPAARPLVVGDSLDYLTGMRADGRPDSVGLRGPGTTVVLAFASTCAYCDDVAPAWSAWLGGRHAGVTTVLLAHEAPASAEAYRARHGWNARLLAVPGAPPASWERSLAGRTPWLYAFDGRGRLVLTRHGSGIAQVDSLLEAAER